MQPWTRFFEDAGFECHAPVLPVDDVAPPVLNWLNDKLGFVG